MEKVTELYLPEAQADAARAQAKTLKSWDLTERQLCDIEMILNGAFSPLTGFLGKADYENVCSNMRLADGALWPMPTTLDVSEEFAAEVAEGESLALRDAEGVLIAILDFVLNFALGVVVTQNMASALISVIVSVLYALVSASILTTLYGIAIEGREV